MSRLDPQALKQKLAARPRDVLHLPEFAEAAVLVPLIDHPDRGTQLLFTVRHDDLPTHAGQISFPGGKRDPADHDLDATATREMEEELGVPADAIEVLGRLDDVPTPSGFVITPVVGWLKAPVPLKPSAREVASVFACEVTALSLKGCYRDGGTRTFLGITYAMHEYHFEGHRIWGATARMVHQLLEIADARRVT